MNEGTELMVSRAAEDEEIAWNLTIAAKRLGISYKSLHREVQRRKIFPTQTLKLITREEALRYLREETQLARRAAFPKRIDATKNN